MKHAWRWNEQSGFVYRNWLGRVKFWYWRELELAYILKYCVLEEKKEKNQNSNDWWK